MTFHHRSTALVKGRNTQTRGSERESMQAKAPRCEGHGVFHPNHPSDPFRTQYPEGGMPTVKGYALTTILPTSLIEKGGTGGTYGTSALSVAPTPLAPFYRVERWWNSLRLAGPITPKSRPSSPISPRTREAASGKGARLELAGWAIRSLRLEPRLPAPCGPVFPDASSHVGSHAPKPLCSGVHNQRRSGAITPACESGWPEPSVGVEGVGEKTPDMRAHHPLRSHGGRDFNHRGLLGVCS